MLVVVVVVVVAAAAVAAGRTLSPSSKQFLLTPVMKQLLLRFLQSEDQKKYI
jgi:hypothetical protein